MSLLAGLPLWIFDIASFKNDFGVTDEKMSKIYELLSLFSSTEETLKREARKAELATLKNASQEDLKKKCDQYNVLIEQEQGDEILQGRLNCDDIQSLEEVFPEEVAKYNEIVKELENIDKFDISQIVELLNEVKIDKGVVQGQKKLLRSFLLHLMVNGYYRWELSTLPVSADLGKEINEAISLAAGFAQFVSIASALMGYRPPFGTFSIPITNALSDSVMTDTCSNMYFQFIKPYGKAHSDYIDNMYKDVAEHYDSDAVIERATEYEDLKDLYEKQLNELIEKITKEIADLEAKLKQELQDVSVQEDTGDEILVSKTFFFPENTGVQIQYSIECLQGALDELLGIDDYINALNSNIIDENVVLLKLYNDFVKSNVLKSYIEYVTYKELYENAIADSATFTDISNSKDLNEVSIKYTTLNTDTSNLLNLNTDDLTVLTKSIELIFNDTNPQEIKNFLPYYDANTNINEKQIVDNTINTFKPYIINYDAKTQLALLCDEISSDFSIQRTNHYNGRIMFSDYQINYVIERVIILELAVNPIVSKLENEINNLKTQISNTTNPNTLVSLNNQLNAKLSDYNINKEVQNKLKRLRLYYQDKLLQYIINADDFSVRAGLYQEKLMGVVTDENGNKGEAEISDDVTISVEEINEKYNADKKEFDAFIVEKEIALDFTFGIKNFVGSTITNTLDGQTSTISKFESDYDQILYMVNELQKSPQATENLIAFTNEFNQTQADNASADTEKYKVLYQDAENNIKYNYSKDAILKIIKYYMTQEDAINEKIDKRKKELEDEMKDVQKQIDDLKSQLVQVASEDEVFVANVQSFIEQQKKILEDRLNNLGLEASQLPTKIDLRKYYLYLVCSPVAKLQKEVDEKKEQLSRGFDGFKAFKVPVDPFDELYNGIFNIIKAYMKHVYMHYKMLIFVYAFGYPWSTIGMWEPEFIRNENIKKTTKDLVKELTGSDSGIIDNIAETFVGDKLKKHLSLHMITYSVAVAVSTPVINPIFWFGIPPYILPPAFPPPFTTPPPYFDIPGGAFKGYIA